MKNVLITGGAGFIGSALAEQLIADGHAVHALDNLSTGRLENLSTVNGNDRFGFTEASVTDRSALAPLMEWCDHCYHLAAPVGVKYIMDHPVLTILDNVRGIDAVLELANQYGKRVLVASTSEVYGKSLDLLDGTKARKLKETDYRIEGSTQNHRWAYANTKALDEFLSLAYYKEYGLEVVVVRFFNTVGPRQLSAYGMVIPNFVKQALSGGPVRVFGNGQQRRSFLHVNDALRAVRGLMDTPAAFGQVFNIGNPFEVTIESLAQKVIAYCASDAEIEYVTYDEAYGKGFEDMQRRTADIQKLKNTLDFEIQYELEDILADIIAYHKSNALA